MGFEGFHGGESEDGCVHFNFLLLILNFCKMFCVYTGLKQKTVPSTIFYGVHVLLYNAVK